MDKRIPDHLSKYVKEYRNFYLFVLDYSNLNCKCLEGPKHRKVLFVNLASLFKRSFNDLLVFPIFIEILWFSSLIQLES